MITQIISATTAVWISDAVCYTPKMRIDLPHGLCCNGMGATKAEAEGSQLPICRSGCLNNPSEKDTYVSSNTFCSVDFGSRADNGWP